MVTAGLGGSTVDTTYPRKGTETLPRPPGSRHLATQLIPARGRKLFDPVALLTYGLTQLIPARGRKQVFECGIHSSGRRN